MEPENLQSILDKSARTVTALTVIVGAFFTINTGINAWQKAKVEKYAGFRQAVAGEETYWRSLYTDYLSAFDAASVERPDLRRVKLFAVSRMASRAIPDFNEHDVPEVLKADAETRLRVLQTSLLEAVKNEETSDPEVARALLRSAFQEDQAAPTGRQLVNGAPARASAGAVDVTRDGAPSAAVSYQTQILSSGRRDGWDVDVFWCQGEGEGLRFARARAAAVTLAGAATAESPLAPGVRLGRVRLRVLPAQLQGSSDYPRLGPIIVRDTGAGEAEAATAIQNKLRIPDQPAYRLVPAIRPTRWYLSVFVCDGVPPPPPLITPSPS